MVLAKLVDINLYWMLSAGKKERLMKVIPNREAASDQRRGNGLLNNIWNALVAFDDAFNFDPVDDLRRRVRDLEDRSRDLTK
jgi:hypothetical protein